MPAPAVAAPALDVRGLGRRYGKTQALDGLSFEVPEGALTVLLGPAGAGKTTTLRLIAGLERPDAGRILIGGGGVDGREPKDRDIAMIFDNLALYPNKTGFENIASPLAIRGLAKAEIEARVHAMSATLRIGHVLKRLPRTMSGGERQRVALGRALVRDPKLFLLDEPLSSLDAMLRIELRAELRRLQREQGRTFLLATPDFSEALAIADTVVMVRAGRAVQIADPQTLWDAPADREVARFVGNPEINLLPATLLPGGSEIDIAGARCPAPPRLAADLGPGDAAFEAGLRPEHLQLADPGSAPLQAAIIDVEPLGLKSTVTVHRNGHDLRLLASASAVRGVAVGETVGVVWPPERLLAFSRTTGGRLAAPWAEAR